MTFLERVTPTGAGMPPWLRRQHLARYRWAAGWVRGRRVIDAACGLGYGTVLLAEAGADRVTGYDLEPAAVAAAGRAAGGAPGVTFAVGDVTRLPVPDGACDVFVSFETIEHLPDDGAFLREVRRVVRPGGYFLLSTPNRALFNPGKGAADRPVNPFHVREYTPVELRRRLAPEFAAIDWYGQTDFGGDYAAGLAAVGRYWPGPAARLHQAAKLARLPWDTYQTHYPAALDTLAAPEIVLAVCRV